MLQRNQILKEEQAGYWAPPDGYIYEDPEIMLDYTENKLNMTPNTGKSRAKSTTGSRRQKSAGSNFGGSEGRS
jgi:hypothetical protein